MSNVYVFSHHQDVNIVKSSFFIVFSQFHSRMLIDHMFVDVVLPVESLAVRTLDLFRLLQVIPSFLTRLRRSHHSVEAVKIVEVIVLHWCEVA